MNLLAFDTSNDTCAVALQYQQQMFTLQNTAAKQQAKVLLPLVDKVLQEAQITLAHLDAIAFAHGPGSFTGIRIATSVAQGLAFAAKKPVIALSTLAILAQSAYLDHGCKTVLVMLDARMQEIYAALYHLNQNSIMTLQGAEQAIPPEKWHYWPNHTWSGAGNAWEIYANILLPQIKVPAEAIHSNQLPNAKALLQLANNAAEKNEFVSVENVLPVYLR